MCGICYVRRLDGKRAKKSVVKRYNKQKSRGKDGFGYVAIDDGYVTEYMKTAKEHDIMEKLKNQSANELLFHHRFPTSTPNFATCAHPIKVSHETLKYDYYLVHNGVITGDEELKTKHEGLGFQYTTEVKNVWKKGDKELTVEDVQWNDSEALAIELVLDIDSGTFAGIGHVRGSIAFIMLQTDKETKQGIKLFYGRNSTNPLKLDWMENKYISLTSEGKGEDVKEHTLFYFDYITGEHMQVENYAIGYKSTFVGFNHARGDDDYDYSRGGYHGGSYTERNNQTLDELKNKQGLLPSPYAGGGEDESDDPLKNVQTPAEVLEAIERNDIINFNDIPKIYSEEYYKLCDEIDMIEDILLSGYVTSEENHDYYQWQLDMRETLLKKIHDKADEEELKTSLKNP